MLDCRHNFKYNPLCKDGNYRFAFLLQNNIEIIRNKHFQENYNIFLIIDQIKVTIVNRALES